jgi:hypothetical protein
MLYCFVLFLYRKAPCDNDGSIRHMKYDFVKLQDLRKEEKEAVVDLLCVVKSFGEVSEFQSKAGRDLVTNPFPSHVP